jgi:hypothetical protein
MGPNASRKPLRRGDIAMKIEVPTRMCVALLSSAMLLPVVAQTSNGSQPSQGSSQTNGATGQRKDGQVVHQDFPKAQSSAATNRASIAQSPNVSDARGSAGNGAANSKVKVRQEFGPTQANKKNDVVVPAAPGGSDGKPKAAGAKTQTPK